MAPVVGIDLGTTHSLVAYLDGERPAIIAGADGRRLLPSVVGLDEEEHIVVGAAAKAQLTTAPERTVAEVKRLMGTPARVRLGARDYLPQEISAFVLRRLKDDAERHLGAAVTEAVVTVPAYFTDAQRQATKDAGELAGLRVDRILNEPTAAALAYGLDHLDAEQYVLVYDLGGGTFDVSVLEMFGGVLDVKASAGNNRLGGGDFDRALAAWLAPALGIDASDPRTQARLTAAAEAAKIALSSATSTVVTFDGATREVSRAELEALVGPLVRATLEPMERALADAKLERRRISDIVLVGGSSRMPLVRRLLAETFGKEPRDGVHPDEAIALGAAVQAGLKSGALSSERGIMITDVCPFTLGVEVVGQSGASRVEGLFAPIIPRNSTVPVSRTEVYATTGDQQRLVDIKIYQGEARLTRHNHFLDAYTIDGIPPAPAGREKVAVTFAYDINGILNVKTQIVSTGKEALLVVDGSPERMSPGERAAARSRLASEWPAAATLPHDGGAGPSRELLALAARRLAARGPGAAYERVAHAMSALEAALAGGDGAARAQADAALTHLLFELDE